MEHQRERLRHVLWIGGGTRAGKTTLSRILAGKYDLRLYNLDRHHVREHCLRAGPAMRWWDERTIDERWIAPTGAELLERSVAAWEEGFGWSSTTTTASSMSSLRTKSADEILATPARSVTRISDSVRGVGSR